MPLVDIVLVVLGIGFLIFIHELGHFLFAKKVGIRVERFAIGFGPKIIGFVRGGTDYAVRLFPLGGYVAMAGEDPTAESTGASDEFAKKTVWERVQVVSAGVLFNAISAFFLFAIAFGIGVPMAPATVGGVEIGGPAWVAGLEEGDEVISVGGTSVYGFTDIATEVALSDGPVEVVFDRLGADGQRVRHTTSVTPRYNPATGLHQIGVDSLPSLAIGSVDAGLDNFPTPAAVANLQPGDVIKAVNGESVAKWGDVQRLISASPGTEVTLTLTREGADINVPITPAPSKRDRDMGIVWANDITVSAVRRGAPAEASAFEPGTTVRTAGLQVGDRIVTVAGAVVTAMPELQAALDACGGRPVEIGIKRNGADKTLAILPEWDSDHYRLGIAVDPPTRLQIESIATGSAAELAGLQAGDLITSVAVLKAWPGVDTNSLTPIDLTQAVSADVKHEPLQSLVGMFQFGETLRVGYRRGDATNTADITPVALSGIIGVSPGRATVEKQANFVDAIVIGWEQSIRMVQQVYQTLRGLLARRISADNVGGPVMIARISYMTAQEGMGKLLYFLGMLSMNLAVVNLLPIPVLDGAHLVYLGIEKVKGSPVSPKVIGMLQWAGLVLLLGVMLLVTFNDIARLF
jgi:regulator of sigma E protease